MKTLPKKHCYLIGINSDGKPVYFGKKESDDYTSRDLSLWYTIGAPRVDAENYHRVPSADEALYCKGEFLTLSSWAEHLRNSLNLSLPIKWKLLTKIIPHLKNPSFLGHEKTPEKTYTYHFQLGIAIGIGHLDTLETETVIII